MSADPKQTSPERSEGLPLKGDNFVSPERPFPTARGVLSKAEIEALLRPDVPEEIQDKTIDNVAPLSQPVFDKSEEIALSGAATDIAAALTMVLRSECHLDGRFELKGQRQVPFSSLSMLLDAPVCLFTNEAGRVVAALVIAGPVLAAVITEACGGFVKNKARAGGLSVLEAAIARRLLQPLSSVISSTEIISLSRIETDSETVRSLLPSGDGLEIDLGLHLAGNAGGATLFVLDEYLDRKPPQTARLVSTAPMGVGQLDTVLTARVASLQVPVSRLSDLKPGSTLLLGVPVDHSVELLSGGRNGKCVAEGRLGRKGQKMAIRINQTRPIS